MKKTWVFPVICVFLGVFVYMAYCFSFYVETSNDFNQMQNLVKRYEADIHSELQTRFEEIPNLVEIVKEASNHEKAIIDSITSARSQYNSAIATYDTAGMMETDQNMKKGAVKKLRRLHEKIVVKPQFSLASLCENIVFLHPLK